MKRLHVHVSVSDLAQPVLEVGATTCCYAQSEKSWIADPQGVQWETFLTSGQSTAYGHDSIPCCAASCCASAAV